MMEFPQETKLFERVRALVSLVGVLYDIAGLKSIVINPDSARNWTLRLEPTKHTNSLINYTSSLNCSKIKLKPKTCLIPTITGIVKNKKAIQY